MRPPRSGGDFYTVLVYILHSPSVPIHLLHRYLHPVPRHGFCGTLFQRTFRFETFIILLIFANCIFLTLDVPTAPTPMYLNVAEYVFTALFAMELVLKVIAFGFVLHKGSYLRSSWNILDFVIVVMSFLSIFLDGNYSALRVVRVLRPLRSIEQFPGLRGIVLGMVTSEAHACKCTCAN